MDQGILSTIKKMLGIEPDDTAFDTEIITYINGQFMTLNQLGVGPKSVFQIDGDSAKWSDFCDEAKFALVKQFIYCSVRVLFDPPSSSFVLEALKISREEAAWRLNVQAEGGESNAGA